MLPCQAPCPPGPVLQCSLWKVSLWLLAEGVWRWSLLEFPSCEHTYTNTVHIFDSWPFALAIFWPLLHTFLLSHTQITILFFWCYHRMWISRPLVFILLRLAVKQTLSEILHTHTTVLMKSFANKSFDKVRKLQYWMSSACETDGQVKCIILSFIQNTFSRWIGFGDYRYEIRPHSGRGWHLKNKQITKRRLLEFTATLTFMLELSRNQIWTTRFFVLKSIHYNNIIVIMISTEFKQWNIAQLNSSVILFIFLSIK